MTSYPLNQYQKYFWDFASALEKFAGANVNLAYELNGPVDVQALQKTIDIILERHIQLRSLFYEDNNGLRWRPLPATSGNLKYFDDRGAGGGTESNYNEYWDYSFDLEKEIGFRSMLRRTAEDTFLLFICIHHIVLDFWSVKIIFSEISEIYNALVSTGAYPKAEPPQINYDELAGRFSNVSRSSQLEYWKATLTGTQVVKLPGEPATRPEERELATDLIILDAETAALLARLCEQASATHFIVYTAIVSRAIAVWCGVNDFLVQTSIAPRWTPETQSLVSYLTSRVPIRLQVDFTRPLLQEIDLIANSVYGSIDHLDLTMSQMLEAAGLQNTCPIHIGADTHFGDWDFAGITTQKLLPLEIASWPVIIWVPSDPEDSFIKIQTFTNYLPEGEIARFKSLLFKQIDETVKSIREGVA